jgi:hypothetical protein
MLNADSLLAAEISRIRASGVLNDSSLRRLDFLLSGDGILERALETLDNGAVTKLTGTPSGRIAWSVASSVSRRSADIDLTASGVSPDSYAYTIILDGPGACTCADFTGHVLSDGWRAKRRVCKHILAVALADALGSASRARSRELTDDELAKIIISAYA